MNSLVFVGGVTVLYTAVAMWATAPSDACVLSEVSPHRLYMDREVHREHLARDAHRAKQLAQRHAARTESSVTEAWTATQCLDELARQLANAHQVSIDDVRRVIDDTSRR